MAEVKKPEMPLLRETAEEIYQRMHNRATVLALSRGETPPPEGEGEIFYDFLYPLSMEISEQQQLDEYRFLQWYLPWADGDFLDAWGVFLGVKRKMAEPDELYRQRIMEKAASEEGRGAESDYKRWIKEVANVGDPFIWGEAPNTIHIALIDQEGMPASEELIKTVQNHLALPDKHHLNDKILVSPAQIIEITVSGKLLEWEHTTDLTATIAQIESNIRAYVAAQKTKILYSEIYRLFKVPGVIDYSEVQLNDGQANISISFATIPIIKSIVVSTP
ncbi:baseplate J/gp47 family protein [Brevibacillus laterosporus]|uniref:baseplate J/gp47 family protein n=1 Tax=Brevibacillus laterosporus TaxID=1465 RepID=UPI0003B1A67E|nr:baseplate J/gp47 family protein [Brevibacillus laterosporus]ERM17357.1 hypothetical protein P615_21465 [Brevibacillus laterosporus PE36]